MPHPATLSAPQDSRQPIRNASLTFASSCDEDALGEEPAEFIGGRRPNVVPFPREARWTLEELLKEGLQLRTACGDLASL